MKIRARIRKWLLPAAVAGTLLLCGGVWAVGVRGVITELLLPPLYAWGYVHWMMDPRLPPAQEPARRDPRPLHAQAAAMQAALDRDFLVEDGKLLLLDTPPVSVGDVCLWQGVYTAGAVFAWVLDPSDETRAKAEAAFDGLAMLASRGKPIVRALYPGDLETEPGGIQFRHQSGWKWKEDASVDSASGWMFGMVVVWRFFPPKREEALAQLKKYADTLRLNGYRLRNSDGTPTRYSSAGGSLVNSPVGVLTTMAALRILSREPDGEVYAAEWARFRRQRQDRWGAFASGPILWRNVTTNHNIAHLGLASALLVEDDPASAGRYANGLSRLGEMTTHEGNSFWIYLSLWVMRDFESRGGKLPPGAAAWFGGKEDHAARARPAMYEWDYPASKEKKPVSNAGRADLVWTRWLLGPRTPKRPIPVWQRPAADFVWQRPARAMEDWMNVRDEKPQRFSPMDFLVAYRLGRLSGALGPED